MKLVELKITALAITQRYGTLSPGDILHTDAEFARHLVEDAHAATYASPDGELKMVKRATPVRNRKKLRNKGDIL